MSRSKKQPYVTDQQNTCTKFSKRQANRAIRQKKIDPEGIDAPANGKQYRKESCSWSIRDFSFYDPKSKKAHRK